ncbi:MAG: hypothetical protein H0T92_12235 [Pyrinomonadaceae bacterium]|nr:hypothetical protein [Pyrinomonadaceae bacterium]
MRNNRTSLLLTLAALCGVLFSFQTADAQGRRGYNDRAYTKANVEQVIRRVEERSDRFVGVFDRALDRSRLDDSRREDRLNERAKELEERIDSLRSEFDRRDRYQDTRSQVSEVLRTANGINTVIVRRRLTTDAEREWAALRRELNALARVYNLLGLRG